jgi:hypothetical protein
MATSKTRRPKGELTLLRSKAALFDELVEQLATAEDALDEVQRELRERRRAASRDGVDPAWREIANDLATALRPYTLLSERGRGSVRVVPALAGDDGVFDGAEAGR